MAEAQAEPELHGAAPPWSARWQARAWGAPLPHAVLAALALAIGFLAVEWLLDRLPLVLAPAGSAPRDLQPRVDFRLASVMILLVAYVPAAYALVIQGAQRSLAELAPALRGPAAARAALIASAGRYDTDALRRASLYGVAVALLLPIAADRTIGAWAFWRFGPEAIVQRVLLPAIGWYAGRFLYALSAESRRFSRIGREAVTVDLLDLRPLAPITRQGLRHALLALGVQSILLLYLFDYDKPGLFPVVAGVLAIALALAIVGLMLPVRGVRQAIIEAKRAELDWCDAALRRARAALEVPGAAPRPATLSDLAAWRTLVAGVREWPFDAPTLLRLGLYLAIPLGSWLGGAVVERLVDALVQ